LRAKHSNTSDPNNIYYGVNGITGKVENMKTLNVWDTLSVKKQTLKTAVESHSRIHPAAYPESQSAQWSYQK
jgi:T-complex protein 1 subunit gamma